MTYSYNANIRLSTIKLNVRNLEAQTEFYTKLIGFDILEQDDNSASLTIDGKEAVLILEKTERDNKISYGLYHTAILVPDRRNLGLALRHLLVNKIELEGGADHGYSEAIYLHDLEGNGIEIYRDKPIHDWDIRDTGQIIGVTEELDAQSLVDSLDKIPDSYRLNSQTTVGHVHLSVKDALKSSKLYQRVFNLDDKMTIPSASWIASGNYHHHLAFNQWAGSGLENRFQGAPGLAYLTIEFSDKILFEASLKKAQLYGMTIVSQSEKDFVTEDSDGIRVHVVQVSQ